MNVKILSVDTTSNFFQYLTSALDDEVSQWIEKNPHATIISVTPSTHNIEYDGENVAMMTATILYE